MIYTFNPTGVCPSEIKIELDEQNIIQSISAFGGCSGNLQGISVLVKGKPAAEVAQLLKGIKCKFKQTSCPDQIASALENFLNKETDINEK